jgi:hypothetical protein
MPFKLMTLVVLEGLSIPKMIFMVIFSAIKHKLFSNLLKII